MHLHTCFPLTLKRCVIFLCLIILRGDFGCGKTDASLSRAPIPAEISTDDEDDSSSCELYLAESTIPGAGLGIFSAIPINKGELIGTGEVAIPLLDLDWHNGDEDYFFVLSDYVWDGRKMAMGLEVDSDDIDAYWPGLDCIVNSHLALINVAKSVPIYDEAGLHRGQHPGAGAISPYHGIAKNAQVTRNIPAGGELFKYYGDTWFTTRYEQFGEIPLWHDYKNALKVLKELFQTEPGPLRHELYERLLEQKNKRNTRALNALPSTLREAETAVQANDMAAVHQPNATRSLDWLQKHGKCIDNIESGPSTIEGAGRGAFAKRKLQAGSIITGSPLHHIPNKQVLAMYDFDPSGIIRGQPIRTDQQISWQLLMNYCFGHAKSTLLLCPYGAGVNDINHNRTLANVRIQWAENGSTSQNSSWLEILPHTMEGVSTTNLAFDYVTTREIQQGEELFLNYGAMWEEAWLNHVHNWEPPQHWKSHVSSFRFNEQHDKDWLRTSSEQDDNPYPDNLAIHCHSFLLEEEYLELRTEGKQKTLGHKLTWRSNEKGVDCTILGRDDFRNVYSVEMLVSTPSHQRVLTLEDVPRHAIKFVDLPYSTDIHLPNSFRHPIGIPEDIMPTAWKNRENDSSTSQKT